jgi:hypothetical protein
MVGHVIGRLQVRVSAEIFGDFRHSLLGSIMTVKTIPVTGRVGTQSSETSRLSRFLDNRLTDGGKVVSLTRRPLFTPP